MAAARIVRRKESVNALVPAYEIYEQYVSRDLPGKISDMEFLDYALATKQNVLLSGPTGSGKTHVGRAYAAFRGLRYYSLPCDVSIDPTALFGKLTPQEDGSFRWVDGPITEMVRVGGVLNISEVNFMTPKTASSLYQLLDRRRQLTLLNKNGEVVDAHDGLLIIADMNPNYRGTQALNAAFMNRWPLKVSWDYDPKVEKRLVKSSALMDIAKRLRAVYGTEIRTPISTNLLMEFDTFCLALGLDFAIANFVQAFQSDEQSAVYEFFKVTRAELSKEYTEIYKRENPEEGDEESASGAAEEDDIEDVEDIDGDEYEEDDEEN